MKESSSRRVRSRGTKASPGGFAGPTGHGFSRPLPSREGCRGGGPRAGRRPEPFALNPVWVFLELHALARDDERAQAYLEKPGCNLELGVAHRARTMVKRSRILRFLREDRPPSDGPVVRSGATRHRAAGRRGGDD